MHGEPIKLDPNTIRASRWSNRHESSYHNAAFIQLNRDIAQAGGNIQAIKILKVSSTEFELVFGQRRLRACSELGVPVLATVVALDSRAQWMEMERENRSRADLSPYEQGRHYKAALDEKLYLSIRQLAEAVRVDVSQASKVIHLAKLPAEVIAAFDSPNDIHVNWAPALRKAVERDTGDLIKRALEFAGRCDQRPTPKEIFEELVGIMATVEPFHEIFDSAGRLRAKVLSDRRGYTIQIVGHDLSTQQIERALRKLLQLNGNDDL